MERANLNDLKAVMAIAKRGTFRGAAIELGMSTTALSHVIGKLEGNLGFACLIGQHVVSH